MRIFLPANKSKRPFKTAIYDQGHTIFERLLRYNELKGLEKYFEITEKLLLPSSYTIKIV